MFRIRPAVLSGLVLTLAAPAHAQQAPGARTWEIAGVPALSFDSDEGFGYGVVGELYNYGAGGGTVDYRFTLQPTVAFTTKGRRDFILYLDAPRLLPEGWRLNAYAARERHVATPWYGTGNASVRDEERAAAAGPNPYYYRFGRTRSRLLVDVQRRVGTSPVRVLVGAGVTRVGIDATPRDQGTTLLAETAPSGADAGGWLDYARGGVIWDTRDREVGPRHGTWSEVLVQRADPALGSDAAFTRWTVTDRRYWSLGERVVLANRFVLQGVAGDPPFHELQVVQTSGRPQEGLGGAKTLRGIPKNRYAGEGMFLWNAELRWRAADFSALGRGFHLVLSGFADSGRTWDRQPDLAQIVSDLHHGLGGGVRVGMGENFVVAFDVGHSEESTAPFYIGLGYLF